VNLVITGATLPGGRSTDLFITDGRFAAEPAKGATVLDGAGLTALPGLVDLHTHLREPGYEQSETVLTGSRAAAAGGFTAVHAMANTSPIGCRRAGALAGRPARLCDRAPDRCGHNGSGGRASQ